jgi:hypothetical protein
MQKAPWLRYPLTFLGALAHPINSLLGFTVQQWAGTWLGQQPWGWISICFVAFLLGQVLADFSRPDSWMRIHLSRLGRLFVVEEVWPRSRTTHDTDELELTVKVRALRKTRNVDIQLSVYRVAIHGSLTHEFTESLSKNTDVLKGEESMFVLAKIPKAYHKTGEWAGGRTIGELGRYVLELHFSARFFQEHSHRIYVELLKPDNKTCARFFYINETNNPLALTELQV